ncbi:hypothetical protein [Lacrimispora celerecrescens]|uniref:Uncharacterized protein n=1 Tax=Lacrimispora celerecrescens TaxID=29354 RepID=A0A084JMD1_9FIRM|nr:hypothetical protein [Lacrimispora celerecrescens]KEZ90115.1 hypothetical protein IO98_11545 [Lacrimispora celerecrescens]
MQVDTTLIRNVIEILVTLNPEYQRKALSNILELMIHQRAEEESLKNISPKENKETVIIDKQKALEQEAMDLINLLSQMGSTDKASFMALMEKCKPGVVTKKEDITISIGERHVSMEDYIRTAIPKTDYDAAEKLADEYFKELKDKVIV